MLRLSPWDMISDPGEAYESDDVPVPYIPHPTDPDTGRSVRTRLTPLKQRSDLKFAESMSDPVTGLHVPICAVTIDPAVCSLPISCACAFCSTG